MDSVRLIIGNMDDLLSEVFPQIFAHGLQSP